MERDTEPRKQYDEPFKHAAVQFFDRSGKTLDEVSAELGLNPSDLRTWKRRYTAPPEPADERPLDSVTRLRAENQALRDEVLHLKVQWDIMKTTMGLLSSTVGNREKVV